MVTKISSPTPGDRFAARAQAPGPTGGGPVPSDPVYAEVVATGSQGPKNSYRKTAAPTVNDDLRSDYRPGSIWVHVGTAAYMCLDATAGAAVWTVLSALAPGRFVSRAGGTRWTRPGWLSKVSSSGAAFAQDMIHFVPILVQETRIFDRIGIEVQQAAGGEVARLGVYNARLDADGLVPSSLLVDAGTVSVATTGKKEATISSKLVPGYYFLAFVLESVNARLYTVEVVAQPLVVPVSAQASDNQEDAIKVVLTTDQDIGADWPNNGLPDPAPAVTSGASSAGAAAPMLRDSS